MMRTLMWKEYREHRIVWLAMMVANSGVLLGTLQLDQMDSFGVSGSKLETLGPVAVLLAWVYGMICGAMLLAGEREDATLSFLDMLPVTRFRLWLAKAQFGLLLLGGQILVLCGWLVNLRAAEDDLLLLWPFLLATMVFGAAGLAFALFFSARGDSVLHTIGMAFLGQIIAGFAAVFLAFVIDFAQLALIAWLDLRQQVRPIPQSTIEPLLSAVIFGGITLAALVGSARIFSRTDLLRRPAKVRRLRSGASMAESWRRLLWLCGRQMRWMAVVVLAVSLGLGLLFLFAGPLLWPAATLFLGVLCGVTVFSDEQDLGTFRFLGDQRLPLGRVWLIKTGARFALLLLAAFVLALPSLVSAALYRAEHPVGQSHRTPIVGDVLHLNLIGEVVPAASYSLLWLMYGFSAGHLCGLLSRKSLVGAMIALMASTCLAIVWVPSLAGIGLHFWQIAVPPLILLAAAAFLVRAWAANRLATRRTYLSVTAALTASLVWIAAGLWYRVIEVPDVPEPFDVEAYTASLPPLEKNEAGQVIRGAWGRVEKVTRTMWTQNPHPKKSIFEQCSEVLNQGWPQGKTELGEWLDGAFAEDWLKPLAPLPDLPLGMVLDPRLQVLGGPHLRSLDGRELFNWSNLSGFNEILAVRGLQQQARGDPAVFVELMRIALAAARSLQHHAPSFLIDADRVAANVWPAAVDQWLRKLHGRADLLHRVLQILIVHERDMPGEEEQFRADYLILRNTLTATPEKLLGREIHNHDNKDEKYLDAELRTAAMLWLFPWEQQRHQRILCVMFGGTERQQGKLGEWGGASFAGLALLTRAFQDGRAVQQRLSLRRQTDFRACQLKTALRLYQAENGGLPATLDVLAPRYFQSLPRDPFLEEQSFGYRRSRGEWIDWPESNPASPPAELLMEVPVMPRADEPAAPDRRRQPQGPIEVGGIRAMPGAGMADRADENLPGGEVPFMPHADEPVFPPPRRRPPRAGRAGASPGESPPQHRYIPKGRGILWSVGEDGRDNGGKVQGIHNSRIVDADLIYLVPQARARAVSE